MVDKIIYPKKWLRKKGRKNAYGNYAWGEYNYYRYTKKGLEQTSSEDFIDGYRQAISDIRALN